MPEADGLLEPWAPRWDPPKAVGVPAHATVLYPFVPPPELDEATLDQVGALAASVPAFDFTLTGVGRFPETVCLAPTPAEHLVRLTNFLVEAFPGYLPYGGGYDVVIPHVSMLRSSATALLNEAAATLAPALPIECRAEALWLMEETEAAGWRLRAAFPLGH